MAQNVEEGELSVKCQCLTPCLPPHQLFGRLSVDAEEKGLGLAITDVPPYYAYALHLDNPRRLA